MKEVYVLRHSNWDQVEDTLTVSGEEAARHKAGNMPKFAVVYASPTNRTQQTAEVLSGKTAVIKEEAAVSQNPPEVNDILAERRKTHPLGIAGAIFDTPEALPAVRRAGEALAQLITQTLEKLPEDQKALIVSHDGTMVAAEKILTHQDFNAPIDHTYGELEGFVVNKYLVLRKM